MTTNDEAGVRTDYCADCGEWINVWIFDPDGDEGGTWILSKVSNKGAGTTFLNGQRFHGQTCGPR